MENSEQAELGAMGAECGREYPAKPEVQVRAVERTNAGLNQTAAHTESREAIAFYESIGADWLDVVSFLAMRGAGRLNAYMFPWRYRKGHKGSD